MGADVYLYLKLWPGGRKMKTVVKNISSGGNSTQDMEL